jgi:hypothetical protein
MNTPNDEPVSSASAPTVRHTSHLRLFAIFAVSLALATAAVFGVRALVVKPVHQRVCPQDCRHRHPPTGPPGGIVPGVGPGAPVPTAVPSPPPGAAVGFGANAQANSDPLAQPAAPVGQPATQAVIPVESWPHFHAKNGSFSFAYPNNASQDANGVSWTYGDDTAQLFGVSANNLTPQQIAQQFIKARFPNATLGYEIPNARVGYQGGYGEIDNLIPQNSSGPYNPQRVLIMVAVKNGTAVIAEAAGPVFYPADPSGTIMHATGAELAIADDSNALFHYWVNSVSWKGDPPR